MPGDRPPDHPGGLFCALHRHLHHPDQALADVCEKALKDAGEPPHHVEGHRGGTWILLDFSSVVVHIFNEEAREFYDLERLWSDAAPVDLSGVLTEN